MPYNLKILMELQQIDTRLKQLETLRGDLPLQLSRLKDNLNDKQSYLEERKKTLEETHKKKHQAELDIKVWRQKEERYHNQLFRVTSNREYDAIQLEIETAKETIDGQETVFLEATELEESLDAEIKDLINEIQKIKEELEDVKKEFQEKLNVTKKEESNLQKRREELIHDLDVPVYRMYERIRKGKQDGIAVIQVAENACGRCRQAIPPQKILEIRRMNRVMVCEGCGRILVWQNDE
ncbi:putative zinc ribbon domain protein [bacterium BMS3Abin05]|nr:putative zinc ribbon domain protein [bacterium BMS3Abin05]GBE28330.1 putative zinc ribbon domain protein [bacterium BMS3Bbin03]HDK36497.1 hypothetical protein [Bacteroidota bacterium]